MEFDIFRHVLIFLMIMGHNLGTALTVPQVRGGDPLLTLRQARSGAGVAIAYKDAAG
jgi:hypothetical protein